MGNPQHNQTDLHSAVPRIAHIHSSYQLRAKRAYSV